MFYRKGWVLIVSGTSSVNEPAPTTDQSIVSLQLQKKPKPPHLSGRSRRNSMYRKMIIMSLLLPATLFMSYFGAEDAAANQDLPAALTGSTPTPQPTHIPLEQKSLYGNPQQKVSPAFQAGSPVRGVPGDWWADVIVGQPSFGQITPNRVVPNKLFNPGGVLVDRSVIPNRVYVYDAGNSRILGLSSLGICAAGSNAGNVCTSRSDCPGSVCSIQPTKRPELIIGQPSAGQSTCNGDGAFQNYPIFPAPNAKTLCGLRPDGVSILEGGSKATMAVDLSHNLYHPDYFNNRVLRYNDPFASDTIADFVWGQPDFTHADCNEGRGYGLPDANSLCLVAPLQVGSIKTGVAVDANNNLWIADTQNNRVLRFPYDPARGAPAKTANLVLGQPNFSSANSGNGAAEMNNPGSVRVGSNGNVYILDGMDGWNTNGRLLVFNPPLSNGMTASQIFDGLGEPTGLEFDKKGILWINNTRSKEEVLRLVAGQLQTRINNAQPDMEGGLGIDRDQNVMLAGYPQQVVVYTPPAYTWSSTFLRADFYGSFNKLGARGFTDPGGLEVAGNQLVVADGPRLLFWNKLQVLTNNYAPPNGVIGQPNFTTRPQWDPRFGRMRADTHGRLWVMRGDIDFGVKILAYKLPLVSGAVPIIKISSPLPLKGGGNFRWSGVLNIGGIAYQPACDCLWLSDRDYSRVFRINHVSSPQRVVDIVLGQLSVAGIHCNQGRDTDEHYTHPTHPSRDSLCHPGGLALDKRGNLFVSDHNLEVAGNKRLLEYNSAKLPLAPSTAIFGIPASRVYGRGGSFTEPYCQEGDPICGTWEPVFYPNNDLIVGFNGYLGSPFPQIYHDPLINALPYDSLRDFYSHAFSARLDSLSNLYVLDMTRNRVLIYKK
jgi:sugar lactone lactonase YvrE